MKSINIKDYNPTLGKLIDVRPKYEYINKHHSNSTNIPYNELIFNHKKYLNKSNTYYLVCGSGILSKKATNILSLYGYNVVNVLK